MTTPSNPLAGVWGNPREHTLGRRKARRISRRCEAVGVGIAPARLREIAEGSPCESNEFTDLTFALTATEILHENRRAKAHRMRRCGLHWLVVAAMVLVLLNVLICMAYVLFSLAGQASPY